MKYRSGDNPAAWKGALSHLLPAISKIQRIEHHKAMPYEQVPVFMRDLVRNDSTSAKALVFTILTGARTGETIGAMWEEFDFGLNLWVMPAQRMKADREHRAPLSLPLITLLEGLPRTGAYVFSAKNATIMRRPARQAVVSFAGPPFGSAAREEPQLWLSQRSSVWPERLLPGDKIAEA